MPIYKRLPVGVFQACMSLTIRVYCGQNHVQTERPLRPNQSVGQNRKNRDAGSTFSEFWLGGAAFSLSQEKNPTGRHLGGAGYSGFQILGLF